MLWKSNEWHQWKTIAIDNSHSWMFTLSLNLWFMAWHRNLQANCCTAWHNRFGMFISSCLGSEESPQIERKRNLIYSRGLYVSSSTWLNRELTVWEIWTQLLSTHVMWCVIICNEPFPPTPDRLGSAVDPLSPLNVHSVIMIARSTLKSEVVHHKHKTWGFIT